MNIGDIKAFLDNKSSQTSPNQAIKQQLQEAGLQQAREGLTQVRRSEQSSSFSLNGISSSTTVGLRVYNSSLNQTLTINEKRPQLPNPETKNAGLFDFEEVAKNVLKFVGGALRYAAAKGADEEALTGMFEQARSGVLKGIQLAEKDLAGLMTDEIENGIAQSKSLIEQGIEALERKILGRGENLQQEYEDSVSKIQESVSIARSNSGELNIRTRDGDELTLRFEDLQQFELNKLQLIEAGQIEPIKPDPVAPRSLQPDNINEEQKENDDQSLNTVPEEPVQSDATTDQQNTQVTSAESYRYYERQDFSFSLQGQLDEGELKAISELVADTNDLADTFFNGDVKAAFNQALELGFDDQELTGFALQLSRQERVEVVRTYENISHYKDSENPVTDTDKVVKPVSQYLDKMLNVFEQSQKLLENGKAYEQLVNGIVNNLRDVGTTDLLTAINEFHSFNSKLLNNLPQSTDTQS